MRRALRWLHALTPSGWAVFNIIIAIALAVVVVVATAAGSGAG